MTWFDKEMIKIAILLAILFIASAFMPRCCYAGSPYGGVWTGSLQERIHSEGSWYTCRIQQKWRKGTDIWQPCINLGKNGPENIIMYVKAHHGFTEMRIEVTVHYPDGRKTVYFVPLTMNDYPRNRR